MGWIVSFEDQGPHKFSLTPSPTHHLTSPTLDWNSSSSQDQFSNRYQVHVGKVSHQWGLFNYYFGVQIWFHVCSAWYCQLLIWQYLPPTPGETQIFLVGMCKSRVYRADFFLKKLEYWEQIFAKISVFGAEILPKSERNGSENAIFFFFFFFEKRKTEGIRTDTRCKKVGLCSGGGAWKEGCQSSTYPSILNQLLWPIKR